MVSLAWMTLWFCYECRSNNNIWTFSTTWKSRKTKNHTQKRSSPLLSFHEIFSIIILQCIHYNMNIVTSNLIEGRVKYTNPFIWNYIDLGIFKFYESRRYDLLSIITIIWFVIYIANKWLVTCKTVCWTLGPFMSFPAARKLVWQML